MYIYTEHARRISASSKPKCNSPTGYKYGQHSHVVGLIALENSNAPNTSKAVLLHLSPSLLNSLDQAAEALGMTRSAVIRRSLSRDLQFILNQEAVRTAAFNRAKDEDYAQWASKEGRDQSA